VKLWRNETDNGQGQWVEDGKLAEKAGEIWAVSLSEDGQYLTSTTSDGRVNVFDLSAEGRPKIHQFETKGSFGMCIDMVSSLFVSFTTCSCLISSSLRMAILPRLDILQDLSSFSQIQSVAFAIRYHPSSNLYEVYDSPLLLLYWLPPAMPQ